MHAREVKRLLLTIAAVPMTILAGRMGGAIFTYVAASPGPHLLDFENGMWGLLALSPSLAAGLLWFGVWRLRPVGSPKRGTRPEA